MQLTIRMPDEYGEKIAALARKMGLKKSDIARLALKQFIEENLGEKQKFTNLTATYRIFVSHIVARVCMHMCPTKAGLFRTVQCARVFLPVS